jgi:hypothetical protein
MSRQVLHHLRGGHQIKRGIGIRKLFLVQIHHIHFLSRQLHQLSSVVARGGLCLVPIPDHFQQVTASRAHIQMRLERPPLVVPVGNFLDGGENGLSAHSDEPC